MKEKILIIALILGMFIGLGSTNNRLEVGNVNDGSASTYSQYGDRGLRFTPQEDMTVVFADVFNYREGETNTNIELYNKDTSTVIKSWSEVGSDGIDLQASVNGGNTYEIYFTGGGLAQDSSASFPVSDSSLTLNTGVLDCSSGSGCSNTESQADNFWAVEYFTNRAPTITSQNKTPSNPAFQDQVDVSVEVDDPDGNLDTVKGSYSKDGTQITSGDSFSNTGGNTYEISDWIDVNEADSNYSFTVTATDTDGASDSINGYFYVNDSSKGLKVAKPKNKTFKTENVPYDVYLNDDGDDVENEEASCEIKIDGSTKRTFNLTEGGTHETGNIVLDDGSYNFEASCQENSGNNTLQNVFRSFGVDTGFGNLTIKEPEKNEVTKDLSNISLKYTITEEPNLDENSCEYNKDGGTNISINSCENTSFSVGSIGNHTVTVWAKDDLGNYGRDQRKFFADEENSLNLTDKVSGNKITNFQASFDNETDVFSRFTQSGEILFFTSEIPKGKVNLTLQADSYLTRSTEINVTETFSKDLSYQMERAGLEISVFDEQSNTKIRNPLEAEIRNGTSTKTFNWGNKFIQAQSDADIKDRSNSYDGDINSFSSFGSDIKSSSSTRNETATYTGWISLDSTGKEKIKVKYQEDFYPSNDNLKYGRLKEIEVEKRSGNFETIWEETSKVSNSESNDSVKTKELTLNNSDNSYNGKIRVKGQVQVYETDDGAKFKIFETWANNLEAPSLDIKQDNVPTGNIKIDIDDKGPDQYQSRTYSILLDRSSKISLRSYLLRSGEGIFMSVETLDSSGESLEGSLVNIQKNLGGSLRTVSQKITGTDGSESFYLDPDIQYKAVASHPSYSTFEGTFSPTNYQYDPLQIQLGTQDKYNFSTRWNTVDYKLTPENRFLNKSKVENIEWTVNDAQSDLTEFGIRLKHRNGTTIKTEKIQSSPSGGSVNVSINGSEYSQGSEFLVEAYFISSGDEYRIEKVYEFARSWTAGIFSISKILETNGEDLSESSKGLLSLIITAVVGAGLGKRFDQDGGGLIAVMVLGVFTLGGWFPLPIFILTFLALIGLYLIG